MVADEDSKVENGGQKIENRGHVLASESQLSLDISSLKSSNSFTSQKSNQHSLKSGGSKGYAGSHRSGGSRSSVGTMKSFKSARNPILELLGNEILVHTESNAEQSEEDGPDPKKWIVIGIIGFLFVLTMVCALVEV
jgi:hypothetical protein